MGNDDFQDHSNLENNEPDEEYDIFEIGRSTVSDQVIPVHIHPEVCVEVDEPMDLTKTDVSLFRFQWTK